MKQERSEQPRLIDSSDTPELLRSTSPTCRSKSKLSYQANAKTPKNVLLLKLPLHASLSKGVDGTRRGRPSLTLFGEQPKPRQTASSPLKFSFLITNASFCVKADKAVFFAPVLAIPATVNLAS